MAGRFGGLNDEQWEIWSLFFTSATREKRTRTITSPSKKGIEFHLLYLDHRRRVQPPTDGLKVGEKMVDWSESNQECSRSYSLTG